MVILVLLPKGGVTRERKMHFLEERSLIANGLISNRVYQVSKLREYW